jgi:hypothetical protein
MLYSGSRRSTIRSVRSLHKRQTHYSEMDKLQIYVQLYDNFETVYRLQFEEIWVSLLAVFSISYDDLTDAEVRALTQCSARVVQAVSALILQTTYLPRPGRTGDRSSRLVKKIIEKVFFATFSRL